MFTALDKTPKSGSEGLFVLAGATARFLPQGNLADDHVLVGRLAHVVEGESCSRARSECFHLDAGLSGRFNHRFDVHDAVAHCQLDGNFGEHERVTERNEIRGALGGLDAGDARGGEHVTLRQGAGDDGRRGGWRHGDASARNGAATSDGFVSDVDHVGVALVVKMGEGRLSHGNNLTALPRPANWTLCEECSDAFAHFTALVHLVFPMTRGRRLDLAVTNNFVDHRFACHLGKR